MRQIIHHNHLSLSLDPSLACWSLAGPSGELVEGLRAGLAYQLEGRRINHSPETWEVSVDEQSHTMVQARAAWTAPGGAHIQLVFQLSGKNAPLLRWQMQVTNHGQKSLALDSMELMNAGQDGRTWMTPKIQEPAFFSNGWQSWSYTGTYLAHETFRRTHLGPLASPMLHDPAAPRPKRPGHFTSAMFGVLGCRYNRTGILAGFLSQQYQFGFVECAFDPSGSGKRSGARAAALAPVLHLHAATDGILLAPGEQITSDWACLQFVAIDADRPLDPYLQAVAALHGLDERGRRLNLPPELTPPDNGWCSWYYYYQNITPQNLRKNLETAAALRASLHLDLFQIDDGFQTKVGDWFQFQPSFADGVAPLAAEIRQAGFMPGLWMAPFILQPSSDIAHQHPDWLLRDRRNRPVNAGFAWNNLSYALDLTHPDALAYTAEAVHSAVHKWGFDYIKLDFLYAAALAGKRYHPGKTRAQILRQGLQALRDAAGEKAIILGCGCPLGPAIGLVDVMRIGADVDQRWEPSFAPLLKISRTLNHAIFNPETNMPSARNAIQNILTRLPLHQRWWINDPDCLLLRDTSELTLAEVQALATAIFMSGGQFLLSDDLTALKAERLRIAQAMLPLLPEAARAEDWFEASPPGRLRLDLHGPAGPWSLLALFNWNDFAASQVLEFDLTRNPASPGERVFAREFWTGIIVSGDASNPTARLAEIQIPPHGVRLFAVRRVDPGQPAYLGSDLHLSQGMEIAAYTAGQWNSSALENKLLINFQTAAPIPGKATFYMPESFLQRQPGQGLCAVGSDGAILPTFQNGAYLTVQVNPGDKGFTEITIKTGT